MALWNPFLKMSNSQTARRDLPIFGEEVALHFPNCYPHLRAYPLDYEIEPWKANHFHFPRLL
jgi:hypothetical protein